MLARPSLTVPFRPCPVTHTYINSLHGFLRACASLCLYDKFLRFSLVPYAPVSTLINKAIHSHSLHPARASGAAVSTLFTGLLPGATLAAVLTPGCSLFPGRERHGPSSTPAANWISKRGFVRTCAHDLSRRGAANQRQREQEMRNGVR